LFTGLGHFEMRNTLRPGEYALCNGLQGSSLKLERRELGWMADGIDRFEGMPPRPYIFDREAIHADEITNCT
jgi:hypothetical protein